jgi:Methylamine utilisation protein MauE
VGEVSRSLCACSVAMIMVVAVLGKLDHLSDWRRLSERVSPIVSISGVIFVAVPLFEASLVALILVRPSVGLYSTAAFLLILTVALVPMFPRIRGQKCSCFGNFSDSSFGANLIVRNLLLALCAFGIGMWISSSSIQINAVEFGLVALGAFPIVLLLERRALLARLAAASPKGEG